LSWKFTVVQGAEMADGLLREIALPEPLARFVIGRDPSCHWLFADRTKALSARHCEIVPSPDGPLLRDLSTNGTFVNGAPARMAHEHLLRDGDRIELGPYAIAVAGPPMPPRPSGAQALTQMAPVRAPAVTDTAPLARGGDPAAMLAAGGGGDAPRLTEILRVASVREDSAVELTKIRMATPSPAPGRAPAPATPPSAPVPPPQAGAGVRAGTTVPDLELPTLTRPPASLQQALARGLGVPESALHGQDLFMLAEQLAAAAAAASAALRGPAAEPPLLALALRPKAAAAALQQAVADRHGGGSGGNKPAQP
jgi:type VI secretion system protein ImpI